MKTMDCKQGTPEWLAVRAQHFCASEASAMLGMSKYLTRNALLRQKKTGDESVVDAAKQRLFDAGHAAEALARPMAEEMIGDELFPATGMLDVDGLPLLASFDGITMDGAIVWENKLWNADLAASISSGDLPATHWPQVEQQLLVSGADRAYFTVSDGTAEKHVGFWYESRPERRSMLIAGWKQFAEDMAAKQVEPAAVEVVTTPMIELPTLYVQAKGEVTDTNLPKFKAQIVEYIGGLNMVPTTDQEFADSKEIAKRLRELGKKMIERKQDMLAQTVTIGEVAKEIDLLAAQANKAALELEKAVEREEAARKARLIDAAKSALAEHVAGLNARLGSNVMPQIPADFVLAIKGKRNLDSMQNAVDTELMRSKLAANTIADRIQINLAILAEYEDKAFLFADRASLLMKEAEDLKAVIAKRIADHVAIQAAAAEKAAQQLPSAATAEPATLAVVPKQPVVTSKEPTSKEPIRKQIDRMLDRMTEAQLHVVFQHLEQTKWRAA